MSRINETSHVGSLSKHNIYYLQKLPHLSNISAKWIPLISTNCYNRRYKGHAWSKGWQKPSVHHRKIFTIQKIPIQIEYPFSKMLVAVFLTLGIFWTLDCHKLYQLPIHNPKVRNLQYSKTPNLLRMSRWDLFKFQSILDFYLRIRNSDGILTTAILTVAAIPQR